MKARLLRQLEWGPSSRKKGWAPVGTVIDDPRSYVLVRQGVAEPADAECEEKANRTPEQLATARCAYERTSRGIHPEDFPAYDAGQMTGYFPDGSHIPGPNAAQEESFVVGAGELPIIDEEEEDDDECGDDEDDG